MNMNEYMTGFFAAIGLAVVAIVFIIIPLAGIFTKGIEVITDWMVDKK